MSEINVDSSFFMPYEAGYRFFVALICIVGVAFCLAVGIISYKQKTRDTCGGDCSNFATFSAVASAGLVVFITWGLTQLGEPQYHAATGVACGLAPFLLLIFLLGLCIWPDRPNLKDQTPFFWVTYLCFCGTVLFLLIPGLTFLAIYCKQMIPIQDIDYYGLMRFKGYNATRFDEENCLEKGGICDGYKARIIVTFGDEWACGSSSIWCTASFTDDDCSMNVCSYPDCSSPFGGCTGGCPVSDEEMSTGQSSVEQCIQERYPFDFEFDEYDPSTPPDEDPNEWPFIKLYGDCDNCRVYNLNEIEVGNFDTIGTALSLAGVFLLVVICIVRYSFRNRQ